jgi:WD40 repeat protein
MVRSAAFSPDGKIVLTGAVWTVQTGTTKEGIGIAEWRGEARLWDVMKGRLIGDPLQHQGPCWHVAFSPDGSRFLTGGDKDARLWETATRMPVWSFHAAQDFLGRVAFSPDGKTVLTESLVTARLWDVTTGKPIGLPFPLRGPYQQVIFSPDGRTALSRSGNTARLWDLATGQLIGLALRHQNTITAVAFSPDGERFVTASDGTAQIWKLPAPLSGKPEQFVLWTQVITGMEIAEHGTIRVLDAKTWQERRQQLEELGGPPLP